MIVRKTVELNGGTFTRTYSDAGLIVCVNGVKPNIGGNTWTNK